MELALALLAFGCWPQAAPGSATPAEAGAPHPRQGAPGEAPAPPSLELRVNRAIVRGVEYLRGRQDAKGAFAGWEGEHPGGTTALVAYTLVKSGVSRNDPVLVRALELVEASEPKSTYSASVALLLYEALGQPERWQGRAGRELRFLLDVQKKGVWDYPGRHLCASNTQFAMLGLRAAHHMGLPIHEDVLLRASDGLWMWQEPGGGFCYEVGAPPTAGITAASLGGLAVLDELAASGMRRLAVDLRARRKQREAAEAWLEQRFAVDRNAWASSGAWTSSWHYSYLWALERYCGLSGRSRVAGRDWYGEGALWLVEQQKADGSWSGHDKVLVDTCFALLFLRRATLSGTRTELEELYTQIDLEKRAPEPGLPGPGAGSVRLTEWFVAGPWQGKLDESLLVQPPFAPAKVRPKEFTKLAKRDWTRVTLKESGWTDLEALLGRGGDHQLWCASTHLVYAPPPGAPEVAEVLLWLELEDGWEVWLEGERISADRRVQVPIEASVRLPLRLSAGAHCLVVLVEDARGAAAFGALLGGPDGGAPPPGVRAAPDPPKKGK